MPQGLQVWDENFNLIIDTSTFVLKQIVAQPVMASSDGYINIPAIPNVKTAPTVTVSQSTGNISGTDLPEVTLTASNRIDYKFKNGGGNYQVEIRALAF